MKNYLVLLALVFLTGFSGISPGNDKINSYSDKVKNDFGSARIGDFVWEDVFGNGYQVFNPPGIEGVEITLFNESGNQVGATITSAADGSYSFEDLEPGYYYLKFDASVVNSAYVETEANVGSEDIDSDVDGSYGPGTTALFELAAGEDKTDIDAGYYLPCTLGDFVWEDMNGNGIQDSGEPGISGVAVELVNDFTGAVYNTTTDDYGYYLFDYSFNLSPAECHLTFTLPDGYIFTDRDIGDDDKDSDANPETGTTYFFSLESGENTVDWDAGMYLPATIEGYTWRDQNQDGIQGSEEMPMSNISVTLYRASDDALVAMTNSDNDGIYFFGGDIEVKPDEYYIKFELPATFLFTVQSAGDEDEDSDVDETTGLTPVFTIESGEEITNIDAGYYEEPPDDCGDTETAGECEDAEVLCELQELNEFCTNMVEEWENVPIPGCGSGYVFNNPSWFAFVAGAEDIAFIIHAAPCVAGTGSIGIQWGVYEDCVSDPVVLHCTCEEPGDIPVELNGLTPGHIYHFFIDGCSATQCSFWIEILYGGEGADIIGPENILCDSTHTDCNNIFMNNDITFSLDSVYNASSYTWIVNGVKDSTYVPDTIINFDTAGIYYICAFGKNYCNTGDTICKTIYVIDPCINKKINYNYTNSSCYNDCTGSINITGIENGIPPFTYKWSTGDSTAYIDSLCAGTYYATITDSVNCILIDTFVITSSPELIAIAYSSGESYINANDGTAGVNVTGGIPPYGYLWNTGDTIAFIDSLAPGQYMVTVTDSLNCIDMDTVVVDTFKCPDMQINHGQRNASCYGECDGSLKIISVKNSTPPLKYLWSNGKNTRYIIRLCPGVYSVSVTDSLLCTVVDTFIISEPDEIIITIDTVLNITDSGTGAIFVTTNSTGTYNYKWIGPDDYSSSNKNATGLDQKGCYTLTVTDTLTNCSKDTTICVDKISVVEDIDKYNINVYPNPASDIIVLDFGNIDTSNSNISIINNSGVVIFSENNLGGKRFLSLNIEDISSGLYFIKIKLDHKLIYKKIVINR